MRIIRNIMQNMSKFFKVQQTIMEDVTWKNKLKIRGLELQKRLLFNIT